jgi:hypothetical protein
MENSTFSDKYLYNIAQKIQKTHVQKIQKTYVQKIQVGLLCSTPLSTLFQLYHAVSFIGGGNQLVPRENN